MIVNIILKKMVIYENLRKILVLNIKHLLCLLNHKINFDRITFPYLYGNEERVLKKLIIIHELQQHKDIKYLMIQE